MRPRSLVVVALLPLALGGQTPAPTCEHIQLRFVDRVYRMGIDAVPPNAPRIYRNSANGWSYALSDSVVVDERSITSVSVQSVRLVSDTSWAVAARLTEAGGRALSDATGSHVGRYLGIVIGNDLVDTPMIESQIFGTFIQLRGLAPRAVADSLATLARSAIGQGCGAPSSPDQTYFEFQVSKQVTIVPGNVAPQYPSALRDAHISGEVLAQFVVDTLGHADMRTFSVLRATDSLFQKAVEAALPQYQFTPAEIAGRRVKQLVQMPFHFDVTPGSPSVPIWPRPAPLVPTPGASTCALE